MDLKLPEILHAIKKRRIGIMGENAIPSTRVPVWKHLDNVLGVLEGDKCQKYIFDSGEDGLNETNAAVRETAINMIDAGLFHLPHPVIWIEDPYESIDCRNYMLAIEANNAIQILAFAEVPPDMRGRGYALENKGFRDDVVQMARQVLDDPVAGSLLNDINQSLPRYGYVPLTVTIPLDRAVDTVDVQWFSEPLGYIPTPDPMMVSIVTTAAYTVKKLVVTLNARGTERDRVDVERRERRPSLPHKVRRYPFTVIRIPSENDNPIVSRDGNGIGVGLPPRRKLIAGYTWGKHTRPKDQQRWINPYWRGIGEPEARDHYEIRT